MLAVSARRVLLGSFRRIRLLRHSPHHYEYEESGLNIKNLKQLMAEKRVMYDHNIDQRGYKWSGKSILKKIDISLLPNYVSKNQKKFQDWID